LLGEWNDALEVLDDRLGEYLEPGARVWLATNRLDILGSRGEDITADLDELDRLIDEASEPSLHMQSSPLEARGYAALASGQLRIAEEAFVRFSQLRPDYVAMTHYQAGRAALWAGSVDRLKQYLANVEATGYRTLTIDTRRKVMHAGIAALEGDMDVASRLFLEAIQTWREMKLGFEEAQTGVDIVTVLDPSVPEVKAVAMSTRQLLERLGARPYLERLDAAMARTTATSREAVAEVVSTRSP
jgi:hypothetical protein